MKRQQMHRKEDQRSPKEELVNHASGSRKHASGSRNQVTTFVIEWPLEQIMQCESWFTKPHSIITSRDLLSTYIVYICFQNKYNHNIRLHTDKISLVEKSNGSKVQPFVLFMFALFPNGTQIALRTPPGPALGRRGGVGWGVDGEGECLLFVYSRGRVPDL